MNGKLARGSQPSTRALGLLATIVMAAGTLTACSSAGLPSAVDGAPRRPVVGSVALREAELKPPVLVDGVTLSLVSDSGGTVPAAGDTVSMLFDGKSAAWILYTSNNGDLSFSGTYSYSGSRMTLEFSASGFNHHASFSLALDQSTVTRSLNDTAAMFRYLWINQFAATSLERRESTFLVIAHQAAAAGNIGRKDSRQPPFDPRFGHKDRPDPQWFPA